MAKVSIKLPDETLELVLPNEKAEGLAEWYADAPADDVFSGNDPRTGEDYWVQKRHIARLIVVKD